MPDQCVAIMDSINAKELPSWAVQMLDQTMPVAKIARFGVQVPQGWEAESGGHGGRSDHPNATAKNALTT